MGFFVSFCFYLCSCLPTCINAYLFPHSLFHKYLIISMTKKEKLKLKSGSNAKKLFFEHLWTFSFFCSVTGLVSAPSVCLSVHKRVLHLEITFAHSLHSTLGSFPWSIQNSQQIQGNTNSYFESG